MLELAILGLLKEQELHGYELKKRLAETLGVGSGVSFGSLYPALARLEAPARSRRSRPTTPASLIPVHRVARRRAGRLPGPQGRRPGAAGARRCTASPTGARPLFDELLAAERRLERRRAGLQPAAGLRPLPAARRPLGPARAAAGLPARAAGPHQQRHPQRVGAARRLHPQPHRARQRDHRARHLLARPADRSSERESGCRPGADRRRARGRSRPRHRPHRAALSAPTMPARPAAKQEGTTP